MNEWITYRSHPLKLLLLASNPICVLDIARQIGNEGSSRQVSWNQEDLHSPNLLLTCSGFLLIKKENFPDHLRTVTQHPPISWILSICVRIKENFMNFSFCPFSILTRKPLPSPYDQIYYLGKADCAEKGTAYGCQPKTSCVIFQLLDYKEKRQ